MSKLVSCNKCGCECYWDTNRNGKRYLAQRNEQEYEGGTGTWKSPHYCQATDEEAAAYQAMLEARKQQLLNIQAEQIANGEIVVGQTVKVYRGRKVPQGTIGIVFWVAEEEDAFGCYKIGLKDEAGDKHFTSITNVDYYFDGADALNEARVAQAKAEAKARRQSDKELAMSSHGEESYGGEI
jgi:hypothetical protein